MTETEDAVAKARPKHTLSAQLADVIESRGLTAYAAAKLADVDPGAVSRFLTGKTGITSETFDKLGRALGLRLIELGVRRRRVAAKPKRVERTSGPGSAVEAVSNQVDNINLIPSDPEIEVSRPVEEGDNA